MQGTKIPFGERQGMLFRAFEVENGLACGCICPGCHKPLNAANGGQKVIPHFRHVHSENCVSGFKDGVRRAAVALIAAQRSLTLPSFHRQISAMTGSGRILSREVSIPETSVAAETVERFVDLGDVTAHAILTTGNHQLFVRIKVFSRSEKKRYERLSNIEASSVEIDLSELDLGQINDPLTFERAVLFDPTTRSWIRSLRGEMRIKRAEAELATEVARCNDQWELEQAPLRVIEDAKRVEQEAKVAEHKAALAAHRQIQSETAEAQRAAGILERDELPALKRREELIVNQTLRAAREWGGKAVECCSCWLLSPPGNQFCLYCDSETSTSPIQLPKDIAITINNRMRSSAKPDQSLQKAPTLLVQPDPFT
ncbi:competence protein CoiA [Pseudomonas juntendi]|uniref:competence protein CoiA n=1 Tax=Pseudomonas juntendi TaxID=2666183 RepID=UPI001F27EB67|nr:competence protein CoiA [Pseudomonas juntendi]